MKTIRELKEEYLPHGYNVAWVGKTEPDPWDGKWLIKNGVCVLAEARGVIGVLRAMDLQWRRGGIQAQIADSRREWVMLHLIFLDEADAVDTGIVHRTTFILSK